MSVAAKELIIKISGDNSAWRRAIDESIEAGKKIGAAAKRTADTQAKESKRAADASFVSMLSVEKSAELHANKLGALAEKKRKKDEAEAKKSFDASFVSMQSIESKAIDLTEKLAAQAVKRRLKDEAEAKKIADAEANRVKKSLTDTEVALLARNKVIQSANQKRIDAAAEAFDKEGKGFDLVAAAGEKFKGVLGSVAGQFGMMAVGSEVLRALKADWDAQNESAFKAGKFISGIRADMLELAALKGRLGDTTSEVGSQLGFRAKTLQSPEQARAFQEAMIGSGAAGIGRQISQVEFDKLMMSSGSFQAAEGGNAATHGQLAGMLPLLMKKNNVTATEAEQKRQQLYDIIQLGGSTYSSGVNQLLKNAPLVTSGIYKDVSEQAALQSAFSLSNREGAGENVQQFTRATVGGLGRMRGSGVLVDEKQAAYLKRIGATDQMSPVEIGKLVSTDFSKQEAESAKSGKTFNPMTYMMSKGYQNQEDIASLMGFHGLIKSGQYGAFEDRTKALPGAGETSRKVAEFQAADPEAQRRKAEISGELAKTTRGAGSMEYYNSMRERMFNEMVARGEAKAGEFDNWKNDWMLGGKVKIDERIKGQLLSDAAKSGVKVPSEELGQLAWNPMEGDESRAKKFYGLAGRIGAAGGQISPDLTPLVGVMQQQLDATKRVEDAIRRAVPGQAPPAIPGGPAPDMKRP